MTIHEFFNENRAKQNNQELSKQNNDDQVKQNNVEPKEEGLNVEEQAKSEKLRKITRILNSITLGLLSGFCLTALEMEFLTNLNEVFGYTKNGDVNYNQILDEYPDLNAAIDDLIKKSQNDSSVIYQSGLGDLNFLDYLKYYANSQESQAISNLSEAIFKANFINSNFNKFFGMRDETLENRMEECATLFADVTNFGIGGIGNPGKDYLFVDNDINERRPTRYEGLYTLEQMYMENITHENIHMYLKINDEPIVSLISHELSGFESFDFDFPNEYGWQPFAYDCLKKFVGEEKFWETFKKAYYKTKSGKYIDPGSKEFEKYNANDFGSHFSVDSFAPLFDKSVPFTFEEFKLYFNEPERVEEMKQSGFLNRLLSFEANHKEPVHPKVEQKEPTLKAPRF
ncbi:MAG: hypothetical protein LBM38_00205 [Clostridiales bacterium]|jgi:hypothetical protein|nr:hypothetical protein [Clostridiales bacterium]